MVIFYGRDGNIWELMGGMGKPLWGFGVLSEPPPLRSSPYEQGDSGE